MRIGPAIIIVLGVATVAVWHKYSSLDLCDWVVRSMGPAPLVRLALASREAQGLPRFGYDELVAYWRAKPRDECAAAWLRIQAQGGSPLEDWRQTPCGNSSQPLFAPRRC